MRHRQVLKQYYSISPKFSMMCIFKNGAVAIEIMAGDMRFFYPLFYCKGHIFCKNIAIRSENIIVLSKLTVLSNMSGNN